MKICLVNTTPFWGGGEKWFYQNAIFLTNSGYDVFVLAHKDGKLWEKLSGHDSLSLNHLEVGNLSFLNPKKKWALRSFFARNEISTVILNGSPEVKLCAPAAKKAAVKNIVYRRGSAIPVKGSAINKSLYGNVITHVIANSQATKETFLRHLSDVVAAKKIQVIPNGIPLPELITTGANSIFTIGTLGRLVHQKGFDLAILSARKIKEEGVQFKWLIAGRGDDQEKLSALVKENDLSNDVEFLGEVADVSGFFSSIDLYVHSARWEGFGFAIAEAMAYQKAIVAFDVSSNPELIENGRTGVLVEMGDTEALANQIISLSKHDDKRNELGLAARKFIEENFTIEKQQQKLLAFLRSLAQ